MSSIGDVIDADAQLGAGRDPWAPSPCSLRQQVLVLHLANSSLASRVLSWAIYDGAGRESAETGDHPDPPFETGLAALQAGWRLISASQLVPAAPGSEYSTSFQKFELFFERLVAAPDAQISEE